MDLDALLDSLVGKVPSISLCVRVEGREVYHRTVGHACLEPARLATPNQAYDLASVTKALAASTVTASLLEAGLLDLDQPVSSVLTGVDPRILVRHLLNHSSGYPWWRPLFQSATDWGTAATRRELLDMARALPIEADPGTRHSYSDIGMMVLLDLIEAVAHDRFENLFARIRERAEVADLRWGWARAAATERCPVRGILIEGTVHDMNCAALGGISTHAGLFGTSRAVATFAEALMDAVREPDNHKGLPGRGLQRLWTMDRVGPHRGIWDTISPGASSTGRFFPPDSVGHLGYTGTSLWIAPSRRTVVALLTNRVHPVDDKEPIRALRPVVHDAVAQQLGWVDPT